MAALLHQAALQPPHPTPYPHHPWTHSSPATAILSKRRRTPAPRRLHASGNGAPAADSASTDAPGSKKASRKEKQRQQQRLREREEQQQLLLKESLVEAARGEDGGGGGGGGKDDDDELPQEVFDRILKRVLFTVGVPMASGVALLNAYDALRVEVPSWVQLLTILLSFGTSALGIAYGTLSASWDPDKEGSLLGFDEARTNWPELWKEEIEKDEKK